MAAQMGAQHLIGHRLLDRDGNSVGKIGQVFFDDQTDQPKWVTVRTGLLGTKESFVPLRGATMVDDALQVAYIAEQITTAPSFAINQHLAAHHEDMIYRHYGLGPEVPAQRSAQDRPLPDQSRPTGGAGADVPASGDTIPAQGRDPIPEPIQSAPVANIEDRRYGDPGDGPEREGVRVLRPGENGPAGPPAAS